MLRSVTPGASALAQTPPSPLRIFGQADTATLALGCIDSGQPHTELDFGTIIWTAFGARLLHDFGYGTIATVSRYESTLDNGPLGHNTLNIPQALYNNKPGTSTAQIDKVPGTLRELPRALAAGRSPEGQLRVVEADGDLVYGRGHAELGWLEHMKRYVMQLPNTATASPSPSSSASTLETLVLPPVFLLADTFSVKQGREPAAVHEYFHSRRALPDDLAQLDCSTKSKQFEHVGVTLFDLPSSLASNGTANYVSLNPACTALPAQRAAEGGAVLHGFSVEGARRGTGAKFHLDGDGTPIPLTSILGQDFLFERTVFSTTDDVASDVRVFAMTAGSPNLPLPLYVAFSLASDAAKGCWTSSGELPDLCILVTVSYNASLASSASGNGLGNTRTFVTLDRVFAMTFQNRETNQAAEPDNVLLEVRLCPSPAPSSCSTPVLATSARKAEAGAEGGLSAAAAAGLSVGVGVVVALIAVIACILSGRRRGQRCAGKRLGKINAQEGREVPKSEAPPEENYKTSFRGVASAQSLLGDGGTESRLPLSSPKTPRLVNVVAKR